MKLDKSYRPQEYETEIYALWEKHQAFKPKGEGEPYSLVVPPPNCNGELHMGHALAFGLQDIAARYYRSKGYTVEFIPGADHAGFETQVVFERELQKQGKSRFDFSRTELYAQIYDFVAEKKNIFDTNVRKLGASVDWDRFTFTLDEKIITQTYETFKALWDDGLIYRGERLVNFCTFHGTAFADIEVVHREEEGTLWEISYPLTDGSGYIDIATTRPETLFGDTAVAVHPNDPRFRHLIGKTVTVPLINREVPIIEDSAVKLDFGTGAVKITPAHDQLDYEIGKRHNLPSICVIGFDGNLTHDTPEGFQGLTVEKGRIAAVEALKKDGLIKNEKVLIHSIGHCYKCDTVIEPLPLEQWFIDIKPLADKALSALKADKIKFYPQAKLNQIIRYLESIRDWNISRQIVWGIPIPAWRNQSDPGDWIFDTRVDQELITVANKTYLKDPDVFDTWFSSGAWPYATLDYREGKSSPYYPLSLMETGYDLLMQWVSRMIMLGLYVTSEVPFKSVYFHGMVNDEHGQKMSKSKGNVLSPIDAVEEYGSDALRIGLITGQSAGQNMPYNVSKVVGGRNFCNKLWNIARFVENVTENAKPAPAVELSSNADHWIIDRLAKTIEITDNFMREYRFSECWEAIYHFVWDDLADWYIEASKDDPNPRLLTLICESVLVLVHPFAPFITEAIWQKLAFDPDSLLSGRRLPDLPSSPDLIKVRNFDDIRLLITSVRSDIRAISSKKAKLYYHDQPLIGAYAPLIKRLSGLTSVEEGNTVHGVLVADSRIKAMLEIEQHEREVYLRKLDSDTIEAKQQINRLASRLNNQNYRAKAPQSLVDQSENQLTEINQLLQTLDKERQRFT